MGASFEEKSVWITLLSLLAAFGCYFFCAGAMLAAGVHETIAYLPVFGVFTALLVVLIVGGHLAAAIASRPEGRDERDRLIEWRAENNSSWVLGLGVLGAVFALASPLPTAWVANGLLATLFLSEVVCRSLRIYYYRRGM